jgi:hypothetical protein
MFGLYLERYSTDNSSSRQESVGGSLDLGFANAKYYTGKLNYINATGENYWQIPLEAVTVNGNQYTMSSHPGVAIDT